MGGKLSRDIIIHFNEDSGKLVCSTVDHTLTAPLLAQALPLEVPIANFQAKGADEAERALGAGLFALLDTYAKVKIGLRDYKSIANVWASEQDRDLTAKSDGGDSAAKYELALQKAAEGMKEKSRSSMEEADRLLRDAARLGNLEAAEYLEKRWPTLKARSDSSFK
jgi:hypothetical protein